MQYVVCAIPAKGQSMTLCLTLSLVDAFKSLLIFFLQVQVIVSWGVTNGMGIFKIKAHHTPMYKYMQNTDKTTHTIITLPM